MKNRPAELRVSRAITKLAINHPFFGSIAFRLDIHEDPNVPTMCTDGRFIKWGREFVDSITDPQLLGVLVHEIYHVVLKHPLRRHERTPDRWNIACDLAINPMVLDEPAFELPEGGCLDPKYDGKWTAEKIYEDLPEQPTIEVPAWGLVQDATNDDGKPMSPAEAAAVEAEIDEMVQMAADQARKAGKLPGNIEEIVNEMAESQIDWRDKMMRFLGGTQPDDYSRRRYSKRYYAALGVISPGIEKVGIGNVVVGWDISGSVSSQEFKHFLGELNAFIEDTGPESVTVIFCDTHIRSVEYLTQGETLDDVQIKGRGGTRVEPVFDYVEEQGLNPDKLIYLTDMGFGVDANKYRPSYPVMWMSTMPGMTAPFGELCYVKV